MSDKQRANKEKQRSSRNVFTHQYRRTYEFPQNHLQSPRGLIHHGLTTKSAKLCARADNLVRFAATNTAEQRWNVLEWDLCVSYRFSATCCLEPGGCRCRICFSVTRNFLEKGPKWHNLQHESYLLCTKLCQLAFSNMQKTLTAIS